MFFGKSTKTAKTKLTSTLFTNSVVKHQIFVKSTNSLEISANGHTIFIKVSYIYTVYMFIFNVITVEKMNVSRTILDMIWTMFCFLCKGPVLLLFIYGCGLINFQQLWKVINEFAFYQI